MDDAPHATPRRALAGRGVSFAGLVGLAVAFFLPQVQGCNTPVVPATDFAHEPGMGVFFLPFFFAFAMLVVYLLRALVRRARFERGLSHGACVVTLLFLLGGDYLWWLIVREGNLATPSDAKSGIEMLWFAQMTVALPLGTIALVWAWRIASPRGRIASCVAVAGVASTLYFSGFVDTAFYGLWVSIVASLFLAVGGLVEAITMGRAERDALP